MTDAPQHLAHVSKFHKKQFDAIVKAIKQSGIPTEFNYSYWKPDTFSVYTPKRFVGQLRTLFWGLRELLQGSESPTLNFELAKKQYFAQFYPIANPDKKKEMGFFVLVNAGQVLVKESDRMLSLKEMQNLVGIEGKSAYIEVASYRSFSDKSIAMICDEEFLMKKCQPTCITIEGHVVHGQVLVLGTNAEEDDFGLLTAKQVEIVTSEIRFVNGR